MARQVSKLRTGTNKSMKKERENEIFDCLFFVRVNFCLGKCLACGFLSGF